RVCKASAARNRRQPLADRAAVNLVPAGPDDGTANHHADRHTHAHAFGVPDRHTTSGPLADDDAARRSDVVRGSDANSLSHRFGATLDGPIRARALSVSQGAWGSAAWR